MASVFSAASADARTMFAYGMMLDEVLEGLREQERFAGFIFYNRKRCLIMLKRYQAGEKVPVEIPICRIPPKLLKE